MLRHIATVTTFAAGCFGQIALERPASVGMPVWLKIPTSTPATSFYPFAWHMPVSFGCNKVEVRRNGLLLPEIATIAAQTRAAGIGGGSINPCGGVGNPPARLPLHLLFRFDQAGVYEVRFAPNNGPTTGRLHPETLAWTDWTPIEIQPESPGERARWLTEFGAHPPTDEKSLLSDYLPNIAGFPDQQSLELLEPTLYHESKYVRWYTTAALTYFPPATIRQEAERLIQSKGANDAVLRLRKW